MMTFKQLEAIYWVAQLGGFSQAAIKLHATQSAISKRIHELEDMFNMPLFDRSMRTARLTEKGEEMVQIAKGLLAMREESLDKFVQAQTVERRLRLGVTELTAMTWLPRLVERVHAAFPTVVFEPDVDSSFSLRNKLLDDSLDLAILPDLFEDNRLAKRSLGKVRNAWMCKPGLLPGSKTLTVHNVAAQRLLTQGDRSGTGVLYDLWFKAAGTSASDRIVSNNLVAIIGMTVSGLGVSHLPHECLSPMIAAGMLQVLKVSPPLPDIKYVAARRSERRSTLEDAVIRIARECCNFDSAFQASGAG